jgi:hypothetical protein
VIKDTTLKGKFQVWITQNMGKDRESSYQKLKRSPEKRHTHKYMETYLKYSTVTDVFLSQKRLNLCENTVKMASLEVARERRGWK